MRPFLRHVWQTINASASIEDGHLNRNSIQLFCEKDFIIGAIWTWAGIKDFLRLSFFSRTAPSLMEKSIFRAIRSEREC